MSQLLGIAVLAGLLASSAHAVTMAECDAFASELNKSFPSRVDKITRVNGTACVPGSKRPVLVYRMSLDIKKSEANQSAMRNMKEVQLQNWCSEPGQLKLFNLVDIKYTYFDSSGTYVGEISHAIESCPR